MDKKFSCYWDQTVYENPEQSVKNMDFFDENNGYDPEHIRAIELLDVGESYSPGIGHVVTRVDQEESVPALLVYIQQIDRQIKALHPPAYHLNAWDDAKQEMIEAYGIESLIELPEEALEQLYERGVNFLKAIKNMMI